VNCKSKMVQHVSFVLLIRFSWGPESPVLQHQSESSGHFHVNFPSIPAGMSEELDGQLLQSHLLVRALRHSISSRTQGLRTLDPCSQSARLE